MDWVPFYLLPLVFSTGLCAAPVLTQPPSASASPGASAKLTCTLSSEHSGYTISWHQQQPGKAPRYLMRVGSSGSYKKGDGIPDRFSGSSSGANRYLTISNLQSEDEADYYCYTGDSSGNATVTQANREVRQKLQPHLCHILLQPKYDERQCYNQVWPQSPDVRYSGGLFLIFRQLCKGWDSSGFSRTGRAHLMFPGPAYEL